MSEAWGAAELYAVAQQLNSICEGEPFDALSRLPGDGTGALGDITLLTASPGILGVEDLFRPRRFPWSPSTALGDVVDSPVPLADAWEADATDAFAPVAAAFFGPNGNRRRWADLGAMEAALIRELGWVAERTNQATEQAAGAFRACWASAVVANGWTAVEAGHDWLAPSSPPPADVATMFDGSGQSVPRRHWTAAVLEGWRRWGESTAGGPFPEWALDKLFGAAGFPPRAAWVVVGALARLSWEIEDGTGDGQALWLSLSAARFVSGRALRGEEADAVDFTHWIRERDRGGRPQLAEGEERRRFRALVDVLTVTGEEGRVDPIPETQWPTSVGKLGARLLEALGEAESNRTNEAIPKFLARRARAKGMGAPSSGMAEWVDVALKAAQWLGIGSPPVELDKTRSDTN